MMHRTKYAIAGTGARALCFAKSLLQDYGKTSELAALFDINSMRGEGFNRLLGADIPIYKNLNRLLKEKKPRILIICTPDCTHHLFIAEAFRHGIDVICEKPLTIDKNKLNAITEAQKTYGRRLSVAFNYRFNPYIARARELLIEDRIGRILSANFQWRLDHTHGREYFRRWHARMKNSGGLLVHKAVHHFDIFNWLVQDEPREVSAFGDLLIYGKNGRFRGERCSSCRYAGGDCEYEMKTHTVKEDKAVFDNLYWSAEAGDGYIRDRCLFSEDIDIFDTMSAAVKYKRGAQLAYSLNAYSPDPGYMLDLTGTKGRMELSETFLHGIDMASAQKTRSIRIIRGSGRDDIREEIIEVPADRSAHGGGDSRMFRMLFLGDIPDTLGQLAGSREGIMSCAIGICANTSIKKKKAISIQDVVPG